MSTVDGEFAGILSLLALADDGPAATVALVQSLGVDAPLWCVTRGAVCDDVTNPDQAAVWGLGRAVALEQPSRWGGLVDLPETVDEPAVRRLAAVLAGDEDQVAIRESGVFARRLERAALTGTPAAYEPSGTVLVTGGTGGIGAHVARFAAAAGAGHVLLLSRRGSEAPGADELRAELTGLGAEVTIAACDVADRDALAEVIGAIPAEHPLTGVFHAAGVVRDATVDTLTPEQLAEVLAAKAVSATHLHDLTRHLDLDTFVLFSSTAATFGAPGQANYAAANAWLDALAEHRRDLGLPATSVAWGPWAGTGHGRRRPSKTACAGAGTGRCRRRWRSPRCGRRSSTATRC